MYEMKITQNEIDGRLNMAEEKKVVKLKTQQNNPILNTKRKEDFFFNEVSCGTSPRVLPHIIGVSEGEGAQ